MYNLNMTEKIFNNLGDSLSGVIINLIDFLPNVLIAILLVFVGWVFGSILGRSVDHLLAISRINKALNSAGIANLSKASGLNLSVGKVLNELVKWGVFIAFVVAASETVGLNQFTAFLALILSYIPNVIAAVLILVATILISNFVYKISNGSAKLAGVDHGGVGAVAKYAVLTVGILAALLQLRIASDLMELIFTGLVAAISIATGIAFGLGGKSAAERMISKVEDHFK
jgi:hypothetical protein